MSDKALIIWVLVMLLLIGASAFLFAKPAGQSVDKFYQECERLGGQVIQARQPYYVCVPKVEGFRETY